MSQDRNSIDVSLADGSEITADLCARLSDIYNNQCYTANGMVNARDQRYLNGGGHFSRDPEWFAKNLGAGSRLLLVRDTQKDDALLGFGLFYVDPKTFPGFADDARWPTELPFIGNALAYTYLFVIEQEYSRRGLGWRLMSAIRDECRNAGCQGIVHEFYVRPVCNVASARIHAKMAREWSAIDTGRTATHTVVPPTGDVTIVYAQWLIPTSDSEGYVIDQQGAISVVGR